MSQLNGKVALVTGGSRGIGAAIAKRLARDGADVAITYVSSPDKANAVVAEIKAAGRRGVAIKADSADAAAVAAAVDKTVAELGRLDILVNNAGIFVAGRVRRSVGRRPRSHLERQRASTDRRHASGRQAHEKWRPA